MPRTKAVKKKPNPKLTDFAIGLQKMIECQKKAVRLRLEQEQNNYLDKIRTELNKTKLCIPKVMLDKTLGELRELPLHWSGNSTNVSVSQVLEVTRSRTEKKRAPGPRSSSVGDDEGYLTAEGSNGTVGSIGARQSRNHTRTQRSARPTRSLSNRSRKPPNSVLEKYKTPAQKIPPSSYGTITPKVKPNTPQVVLRRPKIGEVALSLQGSPLFTGSVVSDNVANINIPLDDGRVLSIQPQRGLRLSQIPGLDRETKRQLETLRDNLNTVCALSAKR